MALALRSAMLSVHGLTCVRGTRPLFSDVDFAIGPGSWAHVRGANGAGKTSLLRLLAGLSQPDAGEVRWNGERIGSEEFRRDLMYLGHRAAVKEDLTALENVMFAAEMDGVDIGEDQAMDALGRFGLAGREDLPGALPVGRAEAPRAAGAHGHPAGQAVDPGRALHRAGREGRRLRLQAGRRPREGRRHGGAHQPPGDPAGPPDRSSTCEGVPGILRRGPAAGDAPQGGGAHRAVLLRDREQPVPAGHRPGTALLRKIGPGVLWVGALLATMLGLQRMFATDHADGTLEQMVLSPRALPLLVAGKIAAHWLVSGLPLVVLAPVLGLQFDLDAEALGC